VKIGEEEETPIYVPEPAPAIPEPIEVPEPLVTPAPAEPVRI
jgi:hypothetical protein